MCQHPRMNLGTIVGSVRRGYCRSCLCAGPGLLAVAFGFATCTGWLLHRGTPANATVVSMKPMQDGDGSSINYAPVFTFTAGDGQSYTVASDTGTNPPGFSVGQHVSVLYERNLPGRARIASFAQLWLFPVVFGVLGAMTSAVGYFLLRYERRRNPQFTLLPSWALRARRTDLRGAVLGGPRVDGFGVPRDRDTGRDIGL